MASLRDLVRTILPLARPVGTTPMDPARGEREVTWVRVLKARVPAFEALENGDLAIIPGPALAVVAPTLTQTDELAAALARARVPAVVLVDGDGGAEAVDALGQAAAQRRADRPPRRPDGSGRPRAERDRLPREPARRARPPGGRPRGPAGAARAARAGPRRAGGGDRGVPRPGGRHRGPSRRPDRGPRPGRARRRRGRGQRATSASPTAAALRVSIPAPGRRAGSRRPARPARRRPAERARADRRRPDRGAARPGAGPRRGRPPGPRRDPARRPAAGRRSAVGRRARPARRPPTGPDDIAAREETRAELRLLVSPRPPRAARHEREPGAAARRGGPGRRPGGPRDRAPGSRASSAGPWRSRARSRAGRAARGRGLGASDARGRRARSTTAARWPAQRACRPTSCSATSATCRTGCARPASCSRRSSSAGRTVQEERLRTLRAVLETGEPRRGGGRLGVHRNTVAYRVQRLEALGSWDLSDPDLRFEPRARRPGSSARAADRAGAFARIYGLRSIDVRRVLRRADLVQDAQRTPAGPVLNRNPTLF